MPSVNFQNRFVGLYEEIHSMRALAVLLAIVSLGGSAVAQEKTGKGLQLKESAGGRMKDRAGQSRGEIKNIGREGRALRGGKFTEWEMTDFNVDAKGNFLIVEVATPSTPFLPRGRGFDP
jgi:hypothetical protein